MDVEKLKALLLAEGIKLPQTNGETNNGMMLFGALLVLVAGVALFIRRRRQTN